MEATNEIIAGAESKGNCSDQINIIKHLNAFSPADITVNQYMRFNTERAAHQLRQPIADRQVENIITEANDISLDIICSGMIPSAIIELVAMTMEKEITIKPNGKPYTSERLEEARTIVSASLDKLVENMRKEIWIACRNEGKHRLYPEQAQIAQRRRDQRLAVRPEQPRQPRRTQAEILRDRVEEAGPDERRRHEAIQYYENDNEDRRRRAEMRAAEVLPNANLEQARKRKRMESSAASKLEEPTRTWNNILTGNGGDEFNILLNYRSRNGATYKIIRSGAKKRRITNHTN
jgi:hypothetical protein